MKTQLLKTLITVVLLALHIQVAAEDTDLFVGAQPVAGDLPNIVIVLDNTANWNNVFDMEMTALKSVVQNLPVNADGSARFRLGLAMFVESGGANTGETGGYVRSAIRALDTNYKTKLLALLTSLVKSGPGGDNSNGKVEASLIMHELYQYFSGGTPYSGNGKVKADYTGNLSGTAASNAIYAMSSAPNGNALDSKSDTSYNAGSPSGSCGKNFIIFISNGPVNESSASQQKSKAQLTAIGGATAAAEIPLNPSGMIASAADEWARFMKKSSLGVVTYTIDVVEKIQGQTLNSTALLRSMANVSGGEYYYVDAKQENADVATPILKAMEDIFSKIQAVNSVFAAVSLPVSVNTQGTYRNQVYIGMFRPDAAAYPRWAGNLKQYKMGYINNVLKLQDSDDVGAINSNTGFIAECVRSYWTPSTVDNYWSFRPLGECLAVANSDSSNYPDGNIVDKGAQAYKLRSTENRPAKTCAAAFASCTTLVDFDNNSVSTTDLGAASAAERDALVAWAQGKDVADPDGVGSIDGDENKNNVTLTEMRPSAHGDVVHSRPVAINFGTEDDPAVVVFYGGNDGILRAVNGNRTAAIEGVEAGNELWSFVAPEFYKNIKRIRDNNIKINFPGNAITTHTPLPKPYGVDGPVTAYKDASRAWIYATMRRGGRALYAFDVDVNDPTNITLKWKKGCPNLLDDAGCTSGFASIGQTWSAAKSLTATGYGDGASPMIMIGGGYDGCEDADPHTCNADGYTPKGNKIYVMDADSGVLLHTLST
ncbi:MAG: pilus assembly protein PilY, partial [Burkholderiaceae bacterium]